MKKESLDTTTQYLQEERKEDKRFVEHIRFVLISPHAEHTSTLKLFELAFCRMLVRDCEIRQGRDAFIRCRDSGTSTGDTRSIHSVKPVAHVGTHRSASTRAGSGHFCPRHPEVNRSKSLILSPGPIADGSHQRHPSAELWGNSLKWAAPQLYLSAAGPIARSNSFRRLEVRNKA
jgi:hypothetical protein